MATYKMSPADDRDRIKITHYINPHLFWFKYESSCLTNTELFNWESNLQTHFFKLSRSPSTAYQPMVDETIAVYIVSWNRWIRAKCDFIWDASNTKKCQVWAIDYGVPFQVEERWIRQLPGALRDGPKNSVFLGGLINIVPAQKTFNVHKLQSEIVPCEKWSRLAVTTLERLINDSEEIRFIRGKLSKEGQQFGNLVFTTPARKSIKADLILLEIDQARTVTLHDFFILMEKLETNKLPRWNQKIEDNAINTDAIKERDDVARYGTALKPLKPATPLKISTDISEIDVEQKCTDWEKRNEIFRLQGEISIDDISFSDSISVRNEPQPQPQPQMRVFVEDVGRKIFFQQETNGDVKNERNASGRMAGDSSSDEDVPIMKKSPVCVESIILKGNPSTVDSSETEKQSLSPRIVVNDKSSPGMISSASNEAENVDENRDQCTNAVNLVMSRFANKRKSLKMKLAEVAIQESATLNTHPVVGVQESATLSTHPVELSSEAIKTNGEVAHLNETLKSTQSSGNSRKSRGSRHRKKTHNNDETTKEVEIEFSQPFNQSEQFDKIPKSENTSSSTGMRNRYERKLDTMNVIPGGFDLRNLPHSSVAREVKTIKWNTIDDNAWNADNDLNRTFTKIGSIKSESSEVSDGQRKRLPGSETIRTTPEPSTQTPINLSNSGNRPRRDHAETNKAGKFDKDRKKHAGNKISLNDIDEQCLQTNLSKHLVLVHGKHVAKPIDKFASANFCEEVHRELDDMRLTQIYRIQSYTWPHLMRGNSSIVVSSARTGRTMSYLPAICSLIKMESDEGLVPDTIGPIGIIIAPSAVEVERISRLCRRFLHGSPTKIAIVESYGIRNSERTTRYLLNGCEVLVTTPPSLTRLIASKLKLLDSKRLRHLIIDNIDFMHEPMKSELHGILRFCCGPKATTSVQLVVIAKYWNTILSGFLRMGHNAQLCIGAYIEAAIYARSLLNIKFVKRKSKAQEIIDFIKHHPSLTERLVIVCNKDDEIEEVVDTLKSNSLYFIACCSHSTADEIELTKEWHNMPLGEMCVLVCTDDVLPELKVTDAQNIIHYSLPQSWTKFSFRFSTLFGYFDDFVKSSVSTKTPSACLILLDENNNTQLPRLIHFLQIHNVENIPREIYAVCEKIKIQREEERICENREFCSQIMEFGKCFNIDDCPFRHELTRYDVPEAHLPINGSVKVKILNIISPTHYTVRLLEHQPVAEKTWQHVRNSHEYLKFNLQFAQYFANPDNHQLHWPIEIGDSCVISEGSTFYRAVVVYVGKSKSVNLIMDVNCRVKLIDVGRMISCKSSRILVLPEEFVKFPHQAIHLRLSGVVPYDYEPEWSSNSVDMVMQWFRKYVTDKIDVVGYIKFGLMDTIWVENIKLIEKLESIKTYVTAVNIKSNLLEKQVGMINKDAELVLKEKAMQCGIFEEAFQTEKGNSQSEHAAEEYAEDVCSSVSSEALKREHFSKFLNQSGQPESEGTGKKSNSKSDAKSLSDRGSHSKFERRLSEKDRNELWENLIENRFVRILVGAFYNPFNFYVQILTDVERNDELYRAIDKFVEIHRQPVTDPKIGMNCLARSEGKYNRAKITKVVCDGNSNELIVVTLFFCDIGLSDTMGLADVLHSSEKLINMLPFQAIRCKMTGIQSNTYGIWTDDTCDRIYDEIVDQAQYLYARPVKCEQQESGLRYWKCDVVLLDCSGDVDVKINEKIVKSGYARYDKETEHYLSVVPNLVVDDDDSDDLNDSNENWDHCNYISPKIYLPEFNQHSGLDDLNSDVDIQFSQQDILQLLNLPPTAKILPPEPHYVEEKISSPISGNELIVKKKSIDDNELDWKKISLYYKNKALDQNANIASSESSESDRNQYITMPRLKFLFKSPIVFWQQSESLISLQISAPDISDYFLKVTSRNLIFFTEIQNETKAVILNFCGCVKPELVSHEIRGLKVIVRLSKAIKGLLWPRLTFDGDKLNWIKYNYDSIVIEQETLPNAGRFNRRIDIDSSTDSDSDFNGDENYMVYNDEFDPLQDEFTY